MAVFCFVFRRRRWIKFFVWFLAIWCFIIFVSPLSYTLARDMERSYAPFKNIDTGEREVHVIVLGGGYTNDPNLNATDQLGSTVALRLLEGIRVYRGLSQAKFITSGAFLERSRSQAEAVADAAVSLGVAPKDTFQLSNTLTTEHEAKMYVSRFGTETPLVIATSALHIKRAVFWFNHFGVKTIIPAPCDYLIKEDPENTGFQWWPSLNKAFVLDKVIHEKAGLWWALFKTRGT